jgi:hypothetical protein
VGASPYAQIVTSRQAWLIRIFAIWTLWVWGTRIWNVFDDDNSVGFVVVHVGLALVSVALAVATLVVVARVRRVASSPVGQPVRVVEKQSHRPDTYRYETNRPLSGMGHRTLGGPEDCVNDLDPVDVLGRRLFERGGIEHVHVQGSVVTVQVSPGTGTDGIREIIENLFLHYV